MIGRGRFTVLIADDEPPARHGVRTLLRAHSDVRIVGEARSGRETVDMINDLQPDVVFLDVQMPDGDGFDVLRDVGAERMPVVIFATAYDSYALRAFEASALDYLLKPYDRARFDAALDRAREHLARGGGREHEQLRALLEQLGARGRYVQRLTVRIGNRVKLIAVGEVDYFEAEANYVRLHVGTRSYLLRDTLTALESALDPDRFLRVHRALIVQLSRIVEAESLPSGEYVLCLKDGRKLTSGRTYRSAVQSALGVKP